MIIEKQPDGWSFTTEEQTGLWHLAYDDEKKVTAFFESTQTTSTGSNLFVGTKEECDQYIIDSGLIYFNPESVPTEEQTGLWHLAYDDEKKITAFFESTQIESTQTTSAGSNLFVGTKEECDQYIIDNGLIYASVVEDAPTEEILVEDAPTEEIFVEDALSQW